MSKVTMQLVQTNDLTDGISASVLNPQIRAVMELSVLLQEIIKETGLVISFDDKGTLIAEMMCTPAIAGEKFFPVKKPEFVDDGPEELITLDDGKQFLRQNSTLQDEHIRSLIKRHPKSVVLIDQFEGRAEMDEMRMFLKGCFEYFHDLNITLIMLQQVKEGEEIIDPYNYFWHTPYLHEYVVSGRLKIDYRQLNTIFGTHADFHYIKDHPDQKKTVLIYETIRGELKCCEIRPGDDSTAREIIIGLGNGLFKNKMGSLH